MKKTNHLNVTENHLEGLTEFLRTHKIKDGVKYSYAVRDDVLVLIFESSKLCDSGVEVEFYDSQKGSWSSDVLEYSLYDFIDGESK